MPKPTPRAISEVVKPLSKAKVARDQKEYNHRLVREALASQDITRAISSRFLQRQTLVTASEVRPAAWGSGFVDGLWALWKPPFLPMSTARTQHPAQKLLHQRMLVRNHDNDDDDEAGRNVISGAKRESLQTYIERLRERAQSAMESADGNRLTVAALSSLRAGGRSGGLTPVLVLADDLRVMNDIPAAVSGVSLVNLNLIEGRLPPFDPTQDGHGELAQMGESCYPSIVTSTYEALVHGHAIRTECEGAGASSSSSAIGTHSRGGSGQRESRGVEEDILRHAPSDDRVLEMPCRPAWDEFDFAAPRLTNAQWKTLPPARFVPARWQARAVFRGYYGQLPVTYLRATVFYPPPHALPLRFVFRELFGKKGCDIVGDFYGNPINEQHDLPRLMLNLCAHTVMVPKQFGRATDPIPGDRLPLVDAIKDNEDLAQRMVGVHTESVFAKHVNPVSPVGDFQSLCLSRPRLGDGTLRQK